MLGHLAATRPIVIVQHGGGTSWWVPFVLALLVAIVAAAASYAVTWRFKRADVDRENAVRAADLVDEAERIAGWRDLFAAQPEGGGSATLRLLQQARVRALPLDDPDLEDRLHAAVSFNFEYVTWPEPKNGSGTHWLSNAITNVRDGLIPHLAAPTFTGRAADPERSFPTTAEYNAMPKGADDGRDLIDALIAWRMERANSLARRAT